MEKYDNEKVKKVCVEFAKLCDKEKCNYVEYMLIAETIRHSYEALYLDEYNKARSKGIRGDLL